VFGFLGVEYMRDVSRQYADDRIPALGFETFVVATSILARMI